MKRLTRVWAGLVLAAGLAMAGAGACSSSAAPAPKEPEKCTLQVISAAIISSPYINPDPSGEPRPVQVRIYQLKTDTRFQNASFDEIWKKDADTLKDDLVKVDELPIYPNTRTQLKFERDESAQFMIAAALFRSPKGKSWFTSFEFPPSPAKGSCGAPSCANGECDASAGPISKPTFFIWIDDTHVEDGIEHATDFPEGRISTVPLAGKPSDSSKSSAPKPGDLPTSAPSLPKAPSAPSAPSTPSAPTVPKVGLP